MKKGRLLVVTVLLCIMGLTGCGNDYHATESTVFVEKKGKIVTTDVESFPEDTYDKGELEEYIKDVVATYNEENGEKSVVLDSLTVEDGVAEMILSYASGDDYAKFTEKSFFSGSIAEALASGYTFEGEFIDASSGETCTKEEATEDGTLKVVVLQGETAVKINGTIVYYSAGPVKLKDKSTLSISTEDIYNCDSINLTLDDHEFKAHLIPSTIKKRTNDIWELAQNIVKNYPEKPLKCYFLRILAKIRGYPYHQFL